MAEGRPKENGLKTFTMEEVEGHDSRDSAWFVHRGEVCICRSSPILTEHCYLAFIDGAYCPDARTGRDENEHKELQYAA